MAVAPAHSASFSSLPMRCSLFTSRRSAGSPWMRARSTTLGCTMVCAGRLRSGVFIRASVLYLSRICHAPVMRLRCVCHRPARRLVCTCACDGVMQYRVIHGALQSSTDTGKEGTHRIYAGVRVKFRWAPPFGQHSRRRLAIPCTRVRAPTCDCTGSAAGCLIVSPATMSLLALGATTASTEPCQCLDRGRRNQARCCV